MFKHGVDNIQTSCVGEIQTGSIEVSCVVLIHVLLLCVLCGQQQEMDRTGIGLLLVCLLCVLMSVLGQDMVNIALGKTYSQISQYEDTRPASHAANNNTGGTYNQDNCIHTAVGSTLEYHWWEVDLGRTYPVHDITVWAREGFNYRLYPFTITVDGQTCVTESASEAPSGGVRKKSVTCASVMYGRRVRLILQRYDEVLNLCEFQLFVPSGVSQCPAGRYGQGCGQYCSSNCGGGPGKNFCNYNSGVCYDGCVGNFAGDFCRDCVTNFTGNRCQDCKEGNYGTNCGRTCSFRCAGGCARDTGHCTRCVDGRWGPQFCQQPCPDNCNGNSCQRYNGHCYSCAGNFAGDTCTGCAGNFAGDTCTGCAGNFAGDTCTDCREGFYGNDCSTTCSGTCAGKCDRNTGVCTTCSPGRYGSSRCNETCGQCKGGPCDAVTGLCAQCQPGWQAPLCKTPCALNAYGENCSESCGHCKGEQPCNSTTGECTGECQSGYTGKLCKTECVAGLYGAGCSETCGHCQVNTTCHHQDGHCLAGCVANFTGPLCLQEAKPGTSQENKDDGATNLVGPLVGAIVGVGLLMTISITAAICWRRKSATSRSSGQDPPTASSISVKVSTPTASPEPSPLRQASSNEDNPYSEIRDPDDTYEISEMQSVYDKPSPYSNDDGDREPYMQLTSQTNDVNMPASNAAYVNTE